MSDRAREYQWYLIGCSRYGYDPIGEPEFEAEWLELQKHAENLKSAEKEGSLSELDAGVRATMQKRIKDDPLVKAVLVGMAENPDAN